MTVTHAGLIAASLRVRLGGPSTGAARLVPTNTGLTVWDFDDATHAWTLRTYDDASTSTTWVTAARLRSCSSGYRLRRERVLDRQRPGGGAAWRARGWVAAFLPSPGSDNAVLAAALRLTRCRGVGRCGCRSTSSTGSPVHPTSQRWPTQRRRSRDGRGDGREHRRRLGTATVDRVVPRLGARRRGRQPPDRGTAPPRPLRYWAVVGFDDDEQRREFHDRWRCSVALMPRVIHAYRTHRWRNSASTTAMFSISIGLTLSLGAWIRHFGSSTPSNMISAFGNVCWKKNIAQRTRAARPLQAHVVAIDIADRCSGHRVEGWPVDRADEGLPAESAFAGDFGVPRRHRLQMLDQRLLRGIGIHAWRHAKADQGSRPLAGPLPMPRPPLGSRYPTR